MPDPNAFRIVPQGGDAFRNFESLEQLADFLDHGPSHSSPPEATPRDMPEKITIDFGDPQMTPSPILRDCGVFYYEAHLIGYEGDGSEFDPWSSPSHGLRDLAQRVAQGGLSLEPGARVTIRRRHAFAAGPLERKKRRAEALAKFVLMLMSYALTVPLVAILAYLTWRAWPSLSWEFLTQNPKQGMTAGGIWAPLVGTYFLVLLSLLLAAPVGILAGVYLNEYARNDWFHRMVHLAVVNLAGVPSIVHALFGVGAFVLASGMGECLLAASCTLAVMTLPVIITSTREALASVPNSFREACWNMGATRWQTIRTIVLPNAISGILTGVILQVARAAGETAPILFTGAAFFKPIPDEGWGYFFPYGLGDRVMALSMHLYTLRTQVPLPKSKEHIEFGTAIVLIGLVLMVNSISIGIRLYLRNQRKW